MEGLISDQDSSIRYAEEQVLRELALLDKGMVAAYDEATERAPWLVENECKIIDFLRTERYDAHKAAVRIARYWTLRKEIFRDRWLRPLHQTGFGALDSNDVALLRTGFCTLWLKDPSNPILFFDQARIASNMIIPGAIQKGHILHRERQHARPCNSV